MMNPPLTHNQAYIKKRAGLAPLELSTGIQKYHSQGNSISKLEFRVLLYILDGEDARDAVDPYCN